MVSQQDLTQTFSVSDFKDFISIPLISCPDSKPISHLHVFSNPHEESEPRKPTSNFSHSITKIKIKMALELFDCIHFPTLVQFWAPTITENQQEFLVSSELPFGLSVLWKGLGVFRKRCLNHKYGVDGQGRGPPGRVYRRRFPEFCPDVCCYSGEEFELRDLAVDMGFRGYLALPVFEPDWQCCIGVLEILTIMDGSFCLRDVIEKISESLKEVGLSSSNVFWPSDIKKLSYNEHGNGPQEHELALNEIEKVLEILCKTHKLPFAQTWFVPSIATSSQSIIISRAKTESIKKVTSFQRDCMWFHLRKGQGIAWKALISSTCCFCKDITKLNINDYALALSARKADLAGGFAISLQSSYTRNAVYILEIFLPPKASIYEQPRIFLDSLLVTMKEQFKTFKLSSGEELGNELPVEVLKVSKDDTLDSFVICRTRQNVFSPLRENVVLKMKRSRLGEATSPEILEVQSRKSLTDFPYNPSVNSSKNKRSKVELSLNKHRNPPEECSASVSCLTPAENKESIITVKADFKGDIIKFELSLSAGMSELKHEVVKRLKLETGSFEIEYADESNGRILLNNDAALQNCIGTVNSLRKATMKLLILPITAALSDECLMIVKAFYRDDILKFELSVTAKMRNLKDELRKRLKLEDGSFVIEYMDGEQNKVLLEGDEDLTKYMRNMASMGENTIKFYLRPRKL